MGLWALSANWLGNFNIRPTLKARAALVVHGPYRWVRHPMYTAVLLAAGAAAWVSGQGADALAVLVLLCVLWAKAGIEERALLQRFAQYPAYRSRTSRFVPWLL